MTAGWRTRSLSIIVHCRGHLCDKPVLTRRVLSRIKRAASVGEGRPLPRLGAIARAYARDVTTPNVELSLSLPSAISRDRAMNFYTPAYDEHATGAQAHLHRYGNGDSYRRERWCATLLLRALTAELEDPRPSGLDISWLDARDAIDF